MAIRKVVSRSIGTDVIAAEDLAANSVTVAEIQDGAVTTAKIADGDVTSAKLDTNVNVSGTLGVGGTATQGKFHVVGTGGLTGGSIQNPSAGNQIVIENNASGGSADIQLLGPTNGYNHIFFGDADDPNIGVVYYDHNNNNFGIQANATTKLRIDSDGLKFNNDTAAANALNDYEEGTWTPVIGGTGGDPTVSYDYQIGWYIRIGDMVNFGGRIQWNSSGSSGGGGDATLKTLPFTAGGPGSVSTGCGFVKMSTIHFDGNFSAGRDFVDLNINSNTNYISFYQMDYDNPDFPIYTGLGLGQTIAGDGRIDFSGHYTVT